MRDTAKHQGLRNQLANVLEGKGIVDKNVLNAVRKIPRHLFIDSSFESHAYQDKAFPIAAEQTISQPYTVAFQTQLLNVQKRDKILEIGTGSGVIISQDGYIVTNNHVIEHADIIQVSLSDKRTFNASLIGTDPSTDLALLKIEASDLVDAGFTEEEAQSVIASVAAHQE